MHVHKELKTSLVYKHHSINFVMIDFARWATLQSMLHSTQVEDDCLAYIVIFVYIDYTELG